MKGDKTGNKSDSKSDSIKKPRAQLAACLSMSTLFHKHFNEI